MIWTDIRDLRLEGQGWTDTKAPFDRLPARAEGVVRDAVWGLSRHSAGLCAKFTTDAPRIEARWTLTSNALAMTHMPATGVSGLDLYIDTSQGPHWAGVGRPETAPDVEAVLINGLAPGEKSCTLYLPLYNGVSAVSIGVPDGCTIHSSERPADRKQVVFYGTSITQGGCSSRPGTCHVAMVGRDLDCETLNLGFSGNGQMDPEVADLLAELDPHLFIIDCLPNMAANLVAERTAPLVRRIRQSRPETPILLVEDRTYSNASFVVAHQTRNQTSRQALQQAYATLKDEGVTGLHYMEGANLLGDDSDDTVDGSHPTDLGFRRQADRFVEAIGTILG
ncbi:MAG: hypothetical protein GKR89_03510 [Candidatus Latescibacteria bacterium]|nr:hypothetical protein [Candidatus Latescibacterota bacterium]